MEFRPGSESFGEDLLMDHRLNDISLQVLRQDTIDHMLLLPFLQYSLPVLSQRLQLMHPLEKPESGWSMFITPGGSSAPDPFLPEGGRHRLTPFILHICAFMSGKANR